MCNISFSINNSVKYLTNQQIIGTFFYNTIFKKYYIKLIKYI